eukprot:8821258-Pyramimonas_sp.AAC.1
MPRGGDFRCSKSNSNNLFQACAPSSESRYKRPLARAGCTSLAPTTALDEFVLYLLTVGVHPPHVTICTVRGVRPHQPS